MIYPKKFLCFEKYGNSLPSKLVPVTRDSIPGDLLLILKHCLKSLKRRASLWVLSSG